METLQANTACEARQLLDKYSTTPSLSHPTKLMRLVFLYVENQGTHFQRMKTIYMHYYHKGAKLGNNQTFLPGYQSEQITCEQLWSSEDEGRCNTFSFTLIIFSLLYNEPILLTQEKTTFKNM